MNSKRIDLIVDIVKILLVIVIAFVLVTAIVFFISDDPGVALYSFFIGPFTSLRRIGNIISGACPLIFTALAVILIFGVGQFSMISEGSFFGGAAVAMALAIGLNLPSYIHPVVVIILAAVAGAAIAFVPAILKKQWDVSEVVTSIMLNYIVEFFAVYLVAYHFREMESSSLVSLELLESSIIPNLIPGTNVHWGILIAIGCCVLCWYILFRSRYGFKLRITGCNASFAHGCGLNDSRLMLSAQILAGAIAGMGGGVELLGMYNRFKWTASPGYGWTGIVVALLAKDNPLLVPVAALFIAYINTGANVMAMSSSISSEMAQVIQGVIMMLIASGALLQRWRQSLVVKSSEKKLKPHIATEV